MRRLLQTENLTTGELMVLTTVELNVTGSMLPTMLHRRIDHHGRVSKISVVMNLRETDGLEIRSSKLVLDPNRIKCSCFLHTDNDALAIKILCHVLRVDM